MIPFQINSNSRADMREFLIKYFKFQDYCDNLKERLPSTEYIKFGQLSMQNAASYTKHFKSLLEEIRKFLSDNHDSQVTIFSIGTEIFGSYDGIDNAFFWDTIIALYLQITYDNSTPITMRDFYKRNLERYGIKYDSHTDYFKNYIYDKPMGEYLNIQARNPNASRPRRYIRNCFPVQQYVLIHSFSKSPYSVSNDTDNPFKMREYVPSLELADFSNDSAIYCFEEKVQRVCDKIYKAILEADKSRYIIRNPKEQQLERQLTAYNIEQAYSYKIYTQIASDVNIIDYFKRLSSFDKKLYKRASKQIDTVMDCSFLQEIEPIERLYILPEFEYFEDELKAYTHETDTFLMTLKNLSDIAHISSALTRPHIANYLLHKEDPLILPLARNEYGGYILEAPGQNDELTDLSHLYIPVVQEFYLQTLLWLFSILDLKSV